VVVRGCEWLHGYLTTNPNVSDADRVVGDEVLQYNDKVNFLFCLTCMTIER
jgi:hypothetical protein